MSIHEYLSDEQIKKIISIIKIQCDESARQENNQRRKVSNELYESISKGRKAHDLTGDIYLAFFYPENTINGLNAITVKNGIYTQPQLENNELIIHIYHQTNPLNSNLVKEKSKQNKPFFCIKYDVDNTTYRLKQITSLHLTRATIIETELLYVAPKLVEIAI